MLWKSASSFWSFFKLTNSMEQSRSWKGYRVSATQKFPKNHIVLFFGGLALFFSCSFAVNLMLIMNIENSNSMRFHTLSLDMLLMVPLIKLILCVFVFSFLKQYWNTVFNFFLQLYICDENSTATEYDFKKALELLAFIEDELDRSELR